MCNPTDENHHLKKKQQNIVTVILRCQKICQLGKLWQQSNAKTVYRTLKSHKNDVVRFQAYPELDCLNKHFATSESRLPSNLPMKNLTFNMSAKEYYMVIFPKDELEIGKIISKLKHIKSHGHDGISNEILRCCSPLVEPYPAVAFNINFRKILKLQKVFRYSKKNDRAKLEKYRRFSFWSSISKVFENLLYQQRISFCKINCLHLHSLVFDQKNHQLLQ